MTIKELADRLGVSKEKIKYLYRLLPETMYVMVDGRVLLSDAAVDAIINRLSGGELATEMAVPPYNAVNPEGWGGITGGETGGEITEQAVNSPTIGDKVGEMAEIGSERSEKTDSSPFTGELSGETRLKSGDGETGENTSISLTIIDHYKSVVDAQINQIAVKDAQIKSLTELAAAHQTAASEQLKAKDAQIAEKDEQLKRMQETVSALTEQLEAAAERERLNAEPPKKKWWQWWKNRHE